MKTTLQARLQKFIGTVILFLFFSSAGAQITTWTYEPLQGTAAAPTPNTGSGSSAVVNFGGGIVTPGIRTGMNGTGCGAQVTGESAWALEPFDPGTVNEGNGAQFNAPTTGYQNIVFTWDQRWSNTSANTVRLQYTTDGFTWSNYTMTGSNTTFCLGSINTNGCFEANTTGDIFRRISVDFSSIPAANNNSNFAVRLLASFHQSTLQFRQTSAPAVAAGIAGTWRFDNVSFSGSLLPGPTASVISGTTAICATFSANIAVAISGGTGPFTVIYFDGTSNTVVNNYFSGTNIPVTPASTKTYTIVSVTNANGVAGTGNSGSATITVNANPTVTATNITTCATGAVALTGGSPAGGTYSIPNPYSGGTTTFTYTYTNASTCTKTSSPVTFTRNVAPAITAQPSLGTQTVCQGNPFTAVSITATGSATLTYLWYSNTVQSTVGGTALTSAAQIANGSKTPSYIPLSTVAGTLYYYVIVTNSCTSVKSTIATGAFTVLPASVAGAVASAQTICANTSPSDLMLSGNAGSVVKWQKANDAAFTIGVADIAVTSPTLTSAVIGSLSQTTYFRAFVQNGSCAIVTTAPIQVLIKSTTWTGSWSNGVPDSMTTAVFSSNYSSIGNLDACAVQVTSGNVVFNSNHTLTVQNAVNVSGGSLTFENNASLVQVGNSANTGNITYKRNTTPVTKYDYTYWSSPVDLQILANFSPLTLSDKYFWWNTSIYNWNAVAAPGITPMDVGKGYIIRAPQTFDPVIPAIFPASFTGVPNNGNYTVPVAVSGANNLNLLGNPYPSALSADLFMSNPANAAAIGTGSSIYLWTHNTPLAGNNYTSGDYAVYNYTGGTGTAAASGSNNNIPSGLIAAGQSFMIKGLATGSVVFKNSMRIGAGNNQFFRNQGTDGVEKNRIWLELKNSEGAYKQTLIGYVQNATDEIDRGFDAEFMDNGNPVSIYSIAGDSQLSIQGRALPFNADQEIVLGYKSTLAGNFEINLSNFDGLFTDQEIYLQDYLLNITYDLKQGPYVFFTEPGTYNARFALRFINSSLGIHTQPNAHNLQMIIDNDLLQVKTETELIESIALFDITGRMLSQKQNINNVQVKISIPIRNTLILVQLKLSNGTVINRKIINK